MTNVHLMEILYRALNSVTKPVVDNAVGGSFMDLTFIQARGFSRNAQGNQGRNYYDNSGNKDLDQGSWKNKTDRGGLYVPPGRRDATASGSGKMSMEDMMAKLLKGVEATNTGVTELEKQFSQLLAAFNQRKSSTLPSYTVQNPRNDGSCMAITTRSGKVLDNPSKGKQVVDDIEDNVIDADCDDFVEAENRNENVHEKTIPLPPPRFPQRLKKKVDDTRFSKFMTMLKQLTINVPLVEALE
ncbi:hypothetical protein CQW23_30244 [Capsicum baccatum]|uniref:Uncharacterized protein n=1 Tax=Capsicum baccatum TaxID=33114 RepID=A0A2G2VB80_CAPBA|nr:hypothetical protein CQW23_30244 [Capsicum baccatum]